jgi:hypothetical protein
MFVHELKGVFRIIPRYVIEVAPVDRIQDLCHQAFRVAVYGAEAVLEADQTRVMAALTVIGPYSFAILIWQA